MDHRREKKRVRVSECMIWPTITFYRSTNTIHPGTVKVGDIVDVGVSFRLQRLGQETKFQIRLDSITVINRQGAEV